MVITTGLIFGVCVGDDNISWKMICMICMICVCGTCGTCGVCDVCDVCDVCFRYCEEEMWVVVSKMEIVGRD